MFLHQEGSSIHIYNYQGMNLLQNKNPQTQIAFRDSEEALEWAKTYLNETYQINIINIDLEISLKDNPEANMLFSEEVLEIKLIESEGELNGMFTIDIVDEKFKTIKELDFEFVNGVATSTTAIKNPGEYLLMINDSFTREKQCCSILAPEEKYKFKIIQKY